MAGWVMLYRKMLDCAFADKPNCVALFVHLLLSANREAKEAPSGFGHDGKVLQPGQLITGRKKLSLKTGMTEQNVRSALKVLESNQVINQVTTKKSTLISIVNWSKYQTGNQECNQEVTKNQPRSNHRSISNNKKDLLLSDSAIAEITKPQRKVDNTPYREIVELYHEICDHMPRIEKITTARKTQMRARHKNDLDENLERWAGFFSYVKNNCSWIGQPRENGKRLNLDWLLKESNYIKIKERVYDDTRC